MLEAALTSGPLPPSGASPVNSDRMLIIDEIDYQPMIPKASLFFQVVARRYERGSMFELI